MTKIPFSLADTFRSSRFCGFLRELRRRKVYRVAGGYAFVGWLTFVGAAIFLCAIATGNAGWKVSASQSEFSAEMKVEHRHIVVVSDEGAEATLDLALFGSKDATLRVIDNAEGDDDLAVAVKRGNCVAGVNGGYFDPAFAPIGLRIIDGAVTKPLTRARLLTGVLTASRDRGVEIVRLGEFSQKRKLDAAVECGPFLVDLGLRVASLNNTRPARRTFAAVARGGKAAIGYCDGATLAQLGEILGAKAIEGFTVWRAMNLDGGSSSAFWFRRGDGSALSISGYKSVRDFVGLVPK